MAILRQEQSSALVPVPGQQLLSLFRQYYCELVGALWVEVKDFVRAAIEISDALGRRSLHMSLSFARLAARDS